MKKILMAVVVSGVLMVGNAAEASFIDSGTYLTDTTSGLDWLDVTASLGMTYNDVSGRFGAGGTFEGWRYAYGADLIGVVNRWTGNTAPLDAQRTIYYPGSGAGSVEGLIGMLGITWDRPHSLNDGHIHRTVGYLADEALPDYYGRPMKVTAMLSDSTLNGTDLGQLYWLREWPDVAFEGGSYLIRDTPREVEAVDPRLPPVLPPGQEGHDNRTVPEPTTIALLGLGLAGLCFSRRKVKAKALS